MTFELQIQLPDGDRAVAMTTYHGKIYLLCEHGRLLQYTETPDGPLLKHLTLLDRRGDL